MENVEIIEALRLDVHTRASELVNHAIVAFNRATGAAMAFDITKFMAVEGGIITGDLQVNGNVIGNIVTSDIDTGGNLDIGADGTVSISSGVDEIDLNSDVYLNGELCLNGSLLMGRNELLLGSNAVIQGNYDDELDITAGGDITITAEDGHDINLVGNVKANGEAIPVDSNLVHTTGNETISGNKAFRDDVTFNDDVTIHGDLTAGGISTEGVMSFVTYSILEPGDADISISPAGGSSINLNGPVNINGEPLADVATSGSFDDLTDVPDIPVDSDLVHKTGDETIGGQKTFTSQVTIQGGSDAVTIKSGGVSIMEIDTAHDLDIKSSGGDITLKAGTNGVISLDSETYVTDISSNDYLNIVSDGDMHLTSSSLMEIDATDDIDITSGGNVTLQATADDGAIFLNSDTYVSNIYAGEEMHIEAGRSLYLNAEGLIYLNGDVEVGGNLTTHGHATFVGDDGYPAIHAQSYGGYNPAAVFSRRDGGTVIAQFQDSSGTLAHIEASPLSEPWTLGFYSNKLPGYGLALASDGNPQVILNWSSYNIYHEGSTQLKENGVALEEKYAPKTNFVDLGMNPTSAQINAELAKTGNAVINIDIDPVNPQVIEFNAGAVPLGATKRLFIQGSGTYDFGADFLPEYRTRGFTGNVNGAAEVVITCLYDNQATQNTYFIEEKHIDGGMCIESDNLATSLSAQSTDNEAPSAKCVYNLIGDIETLLSGLR